jgi:hypothetical protein
VPDLALGCVCRASVTAFGLRAATPGNASAGPSGVRLSCSQFRNVATLTPINKAHSACEASSFARTALTSVGSNAVVRPDRPVARQVADDWRTLETNS